MKISFTALLAGALLFIGSAQAGQVYLDDPDPTGFHIFDNCGGACYNWEFLYVPAHYAFEWELSSYVEPSQGGVYYSLLTEAGTIIGVGEFNVVIGTKHIHVDYYGRGGAWDFTDPDDVRGIVGGAYFFRSAESTGGYTDLFDFTSISGENQGTVDSFFVSSSRAAPEPGTLALALLATFILGFGRFRPLSRG